MDVSITSSFLVQAFPTLAAARGSGEPVLGREKVGCKGAALGWRELKGQCRVGHISAVKSSNQGWWQRDRAPAESGLRGLEERTTVWVEKIS